MPASQLSRLIALLKGPEAGVVGWGAGAFAALLASHFVLRPVRDSIVTEGDLAFVPWLFTATFTLTLVLAPAWGRLVATTHRRRFVAIAYHVVAASAVAFAILLTLNATSAVLGNSFYVWHAVINLFMVSVLWSVCADSLGPERAKRLYGPIAVGGTVGAVVGPLATKLLVGVLGTEALLVASAGLMELAILAVWQLDRAARRLPATSAGDPEVDAIADKPVPGVPWSGLTDVGRTPYLVGVALFVLLTAIAATFVYLEQLEITKAAFGKDRDLKTEFNATVDFYTNSCAFVLQALVAAPLLRWLGAGAVLAILPLVQGGAIIALVAAPTLATLLVVQVAARATTHGLIRPGRELLFTVVSREQKYRAKNVIDTLVYRFGDVCSAWLHRGLVVAGLGGAALVAIALGIAVVWLVTAIALGLAFRRRAPR